MTNVRNCATVRKVVRRADVYTPGGLPPHVSYYRIDGRRWRVTWYQHAPDSRSENPYGRFTARNHGGWVTWDEGA